MIQRIIFRNFLQYNRQTRFFFFVIITLGFVIDGVYAVLLNLYLLRLGYGTEFIGLVNAVGLITFAFTSLPAGIMGSRWSNTLMLKGGIGVIAIGGLLLPFAEFAPSGWQETWLLVSYAMMLGGFSLFFVNGAPFLMNIVDSGRQNNAFAVQTALMSLAAFGGSLVGGALPELIASFQTITLDDPAPYRLTLMFTSLVLVIAFFLILFITDSSEQASLSSEHVSSAGWHKRSETDISTNVHWTIQAVFLISIMTFVRLLQVAGMATVSVYYNVYMDTQLHVSTGVIGAIAAIGRMLGVPTALAVPFLVRRWGNANVVVVGSLATAFCLLPIALIPNWFAAAIGFVLMQAMTSIRYTAFVVYILELVPKAQQSIMAGSGEMAAGFSFALIALGGGIILSLFTFRDLFLLGAGLTTFGTFIFWLHFRLLKAKRKLKLAI